jgi:hypothetical protein
MSGINDVICFPAAMEAVVFGLKVLRLILRHLDEL